MRITGVVGARPNFMKISPIAEAIKKGARHEFALVHTGQHYDSSMSDVFFKDLGLPEPDIFLEAGSGSHAEQTAKVMLRFEEVIQKSKPDLVMVVGDVNSTLACSLVAAKMRVKVAHVEAGLRSFDREMPEEINRVLTDAISDLLFTTCDDADKNLKREGIPEEKIRFVGNVMIDTLLHLKGRAEETGFSQEMGLSRGEFALLTLHRPRNVDIKDRLVNILSALDRIRERIKIVWPLHPRAKSMMKEHGFYDSLKRKENMLITEPLGYLQFMNLMINAGLAMTDSGGIQEETTVLNIPCLTIRDNTERPVTITQGTNVLVGSDAGRLVSEAENILDGKRKKGRTPKYWDGKAAGRITAALDSFDEGR